MNENKDNDFYRAYVLEENDIPGASLHGKKPNELTMMQLKHVKVLQ